jgi:hypothetical protein
MAGYEKGEAVCLDDVNDAYYFGKSFRVFGQYRYRNGNWVVRRDGKTILEEMVNFKGVRRDRISHMKRVLGIGKS